MLPVDLSGRNALVFGVANDRSIAWAIARLLHQAGARLALAYQNERVEGMVARLARTLETEVLLLRCDVTRDEDLTSTFERVEREMGSLSILVHSIAYAQREDLGGPFSRLSWEGFRIALAVSAYSLIPMARLAVPLMERAGGGSILALTFQASERVFPGYNVMGVAKSALENIVRQLAAELGPHNIRVNALSPGPLDTLSGRAIRGFVEMKRIWQERAPLRRTVTHEEVARSALFLLSDLSTGITGVVLPVDAGYHIMGI